MLRGGARVSEMGPNCAPTPKFLALPRIGVACHLVRTVMLSDESVTIHNIIRQPRRTYLVLDAVVQNTVH